MVHTAVDHTAVDQLDISDTGLRHIPKDLLRLRKAGQHLSSLIGNSQYVLGLVRTSQQLHIDGYLILRRFLSKGSLLFQIVGITVSHVYITCILAEPEITDSYIVIIHIVASPIEDELSAGVFCARRYPLLALNIKGKPKL